MCGELYVVLEPGRSVALRLLVRLPDETVVGAEKYDKLFGNECEKSNQEPAMQLCTNLWNRYIVT